MGSMTEVGDHITGQVDGALAAMGHGPFVSQASCVDVLLDLYAVADGTVLQPLVAAALARISKVNLVEAGRFRSVLLELAAMAAVAHAAESVEVAEAMGVAEVDAAEAVDAADAVDASVLDAA